MQYQRSESCHVASMNQSNVQRRIPAKAKPKRQSDATSDQSKRESRTKSDRHAVESQEPSLHNESEEQKARRGKAKNARTTANLAITNAQAKDAMAKTLDESREPVTQSQQS